LIEEEIKEEQINSASSQQKSPVDVIVERVLQRGMIMEGGDKVPYGIIKGIRKLIMKELDLES
jgi:DNA polymerase elongation subunit (family B)